MKNEKLQWHPAFSAALRITLGDEMQYLGDFIPMQFLYLPKLDKEENYWLQSLRNNLKAGEEIRTLMSNYEKNRTSKDYSAVMNLITRANWEQMEVEKKMCDALNELFAEELREADLRGRTEGLKLGKSEGLHQAAVETYQEMGLNYQDTRSRIKEKYQLTEDEARKIMEKHWKFT
jgi:hypothetical protein